MATVSNGIPYLLGGEKPTAALMNALHMTLDRKLTKMLSGKSPIIAQAGTFPSFLLGKCFFFTSGGAVYANKVPGYQSNSNAVLNPGGGLFGGPIVELPVARPYNPWQCTVATGGPYTDEFTTAINAMVALNGTTPGTITFDEVNKIANLTVRFPSAIGDTGHYPTVAPSTMGLPCYSDAYGSPAQNVGYLENSMIAHYILHQGRERHGGGALLPQGGAMRGGAAFGLGCGGNHHRGADEHHAAGHLGQIQFLPRPQPQQRGLHGIVWRSLHLEAAAVRVRNGAADCAGWNLRRERELLLLRARRRSALLLVHSKRHGQHQRRGQHLVGLGWAGDGHDGGEQFDEPGRVAGLGGILHARRG